MEWLTRWWRELLRDVVLTGSGLGIIGSQVFALHPNPYLIGAGLTLTVPSTVVKLRELASGSGSSGLSSPPPGPGPSPPGRGHTGD